MFVVLYIGYGKAGRNYHMRSISETVNSMVKCRFGNHLRKKLDSRKETETRLKLVAHDIRRVGYIEVMGEIQPKWYQMGE